MFKKVLSILLCVCISISMGTVSFAKDLEMTRASSSFYQEIPQPDGSIVVISSEPPPGVEIQNTNPRDVYDDCGHYSPSGYRYIGYANGNTVFDAFVSGTALTLSGTAISVITGLVFYPTLVGVLGAGLSLSDSSVQGNYKVRSYEDMDPGIYPYIYWHHTECVVQLNDRGDEAFVCNAYYEYALLP